MKVISMYLPQYHMVKENNEWWGEGFTDWISAKNSKPMFQGHYQPHEPLDDRYYDLLEKDTMEWQANIMNQYGVDGLCFYHYWFKEGRRILEKPAEKLLEWEEIDMPFCFCWANETWARSWSGLRNVNTWADNQEPIKKDGDKAILLEQNYGLQEDWLEHFNYLLPFFKDSRYIKKDNKPVFLIYKALDIHCLSEMADYFIELAIKNGFDGIYFICANSVGKLPKSIEGILIHEPQSSFRSLVSNKVENNVFKVDGTECWNSILSTQKGDRTTYYEGIVGYDDTPRRGKNGIVITGITPDLFKKNMMELMAKSKKEENEFLFLNAWNEWGEGMHLEPDKKWGYQFLEKLYEAKNEYQNIRVEENHDFLIKELERTKLKSDKFELYLNTLDRWLVNRESGIDISDYFVRHGYKNIGIYAYNIFTQHLIYELRDSDIEILCIMDQQKDKLKIDLPIPILLPTDELPHMDVVVITSFFYYEQIKECMNRKDYKLVSIESVIKESE